MEPASPHRDIGRSFLALRKRHLPLLKARRLASLSIKDLGRASKFIGMRVQLSDDGGYRLDWDEAIGGLLWSNGLTDANATLTPTVDDINAEQPSDAELVGSANAPPEPTVRAFQSLVATRQTHASHVLDWSLAKRIARYLKGTATLKLTMKPSRDDNAALRHDAFSDATLRAIGQTESR
uniref:Uncharacterized protein n=1 Tax=Peronospora matthiolae TaxID=2874970 RepID=A0AAV1TB71_9STRA